MLVERTAVGIMSLRTQGWVGWGWGNGSMTAGGGELALPLRAKKHMGLETRKFLCG